VLAPREGKGRGEVVYQHSTMKVLLFGLICRASVAPIVAPTIASELVVVLVVYLGVSSSVSWKWLLLV